MFRTTSGRTGNGHVRRELLHARTSRCQDDFRGPVRAYSPRVVVRQLLPDRDSRDSKAGQAVMFATTAFPSSSGLSYQWASASSYTRTLASGSWRTISPDLALPWLDRDGQLSSPAISPSDHNNKATAKSCRRMTSCESRRPGREITPTKGEPRAPAETSGRQTMRCKAAIRSSPSSVRRGPHCSRASQRLDPAKQTIIALVEESEHRPLPCALLAIGLDFWR